MGQKGVQSLANVLRQNDQFKRRVGRVVGRHEWEHKQGDATALLHLT